MANASLCYRDRVTRADERPRHRIARVTKAVDLLTEGARPASECWHVAVELEPSE